MDNRNTLIGTMLIGLLLMIFLIYTSNKQKENLKNKKPNSGQVASEPKITAPEQKIHAITSSEELQKDSLISAELYGPFASSIQGKAENYILENEVQKIVVSSKGGFIQSIELKKYKTWDGKP
ncbi:MAG: hypothetical protein NZ522_05790, partial [Chitinophagales bacterium]|nr:hypothetical protein [Chitinophagales bacterium]